MSESSLEENCLLADDVTAVEKRKSERWGIEGSRPPRSKGGKEDSIEDSDDIRFMIGLGDVVDGRLVVVVLLGIWVVLGVVVVVVRLQPYYPKWSTDKMNSKINGTWDNLLES
jgi:hypothetical protein